MRLARVTPAVALLLAGAFLLLSAAGCGNPALSSGKLYVRQQNWESAVEQLQQAVAQIPTNYEAHFYLAMSLAELERYQAAAVHFQEARELDPLKAEEIDRQQQHYWSALYNSGVELTNEGEFFDAIDTFKLAAEVWPEDPRAYRNMGYAYTRLEGSETDRADNMAQAISHMRRAASLDSSDVASWLDLAATHRRIQQLDEAVEAFQEALAHEATDDQRTEAYSRMGDIYFVQKEWGSALVMYRKALDVVPEDMQIWYQLGVTCFNQEDYPGAVDCFQSAADYSEGEDEDIYEDALYNMGLAALSAEMFEKALDSAEILLVLKPDDPTYYVLRARSKRKIAQRLEVEGEVEEAQRLTEEVLEDFRRADELGGG